MAAKTGLQTGDRAPLFELPDQDGRTVSLESFIGERNVVLFFYPRDESAGCTKEACAFRDSYEAFREAGAEIIGVSGDSESAHRKFIANHRLPFVLLSDQGNRVRKLYGVPSTLLVIPGRVTFVIDKAGVIRHVFNSQLNFLGHVEEALQVLRRLNQG